MAELLREDAKKARNADALEVFLSQLQSSKEDLVDADAALIDNDRLISEMTTVYTKRKADAEGRITSLRAQIVVLETTVNADGDYTAAELLQYANAKKDEV